jgi:hypothetical protein
MGEEKINGIKVRGSIIIKKNMRRLVKPDPQRIPDKAARY